MEGHRVRRQRSSTTKTKQPEPLERIQPNAAGIDCGSRHHHVAVPVDRDPEPVRRFKTFTPDLYRMVDWLEACRIDTVAMEATGVYWIPIYDILEQRCFRHQLLLSHPYLVLTKPLRLDIQCQRGGSVKIGWKYLDD